MTVRADLDTIREPFAWVCPDCKRHVADSEFRCGGPHLRGKKWEYDFVDTVPVIPLDRLAGCVILERAEWDAVLADERAVLELPSGSHGWYEARKRIRQRALLDARLGGTNPLPDPSAPHEHVSKPF